jgi:hypothetical protein
MLKCKWLLTLQRNIWGGGGFMLHEFLFTSRAWESSLLSILIFFYVFLPYPFSFIHSLVSNMAFFSGIVKSSLSLLGKDNSGFGYSIGDKVEFYSDQSIWSLHHGTKKVLFEQ